jgi:hypothetical protein
MGYDLHITRRKNWSDTGNDISPPEWLACVEKDPELTLSPENGLYFVQWSGKSRDPNPWLDWDQGNIFTKNPDEPLIEKMVAIATELRAVVQGDDGEIYGAGGEAPQLLRPSLVGRLHKWFRALRPARPLAPLTPTFKAGDRVKDAFHQETTVVEIDLSANHGLGRVKVRYDDGRERTVALVACGLTRIEGGTENKSS